MATVPPEDQDVIGGVDTHKDVHAAAVLGATGRLLGTAVFPKTSAGHDQLLAWLKSYGRVIRVGVEGTGSYGAGLMRHLRSSRSRIQLAAGTCRQFHPVAARLSARCSHSRRHVRGAAGRGSAMTLHLKHEHLLTFVSVMVAAWALGTFLVIDFWPHLAYNAFEKAIVEKGFGDGPIPVNTLQTKRQTLFADPLHPPPSASNLATTGVNRDTLLTVGWLDLSKGPQVLHVPDMQGRYYSVQFTDRSDGTDFAYVGTRTTSTDAGDYLITGPGWKGAIPQGLAQISSPNNSALVIGRVFVEGDADLSTVYALSKQIQLTPL